MEPIFAMGRIQTINIKENHIPKKKTIPLCKSFTICTTTCYVIESSSIQCKSQSYTDNKNRVYKTVTDQHTYIQVLETSFR